MFRKFTPILAVLLLFSCSTAPITGRKQFKPLSSQQMVSLGQSNYQQVLKQEPRSDEQTNAQLVQEVGRRVAKAAEAYLQEQNRADLVEGFEWEFTLLKGDKVNAWAMPGGKVAFYEGIMPICEDADGVAVVMGHEIAHAIIGHSNERMSQQLAVQLGGAGLAAALRNKPQVTQELSMAAFGLGAQVGLLLPYSRIHESEADEVGLYFMAMAGYNPREAPKFWQRMQAESSGQQPPVFLSTHPSPDQRVKKLKKLVPKVLRYRRKH